MKMKSIHCLTNDNGDRYLQYCDHTILEKKNARFPTIIRATNFCYFFALCFTELNNS